MAKVMQPVNPPSLAKPTGYSHGIEVQGVKTLFISGQVAFDKNLAEMKARMANRSNGSS